MDEQQTPTMSQQSPQEKVDWKRHFTTVTPLSKALAMLLFVALPFIGFWVGVNYATDFMVDESSNTDTRSLSVVDDGISGVARENGTDMNPECRTELFGCPGGVFVDEGYYCKVPICPSTLNEVFASELGENWTTYSHPTGLSVQYPETFSLDSLCSSYEPVSPDDCQTGLRIYGNARRLTITFNSLEGTVAENLGSNEYMRNNIEIIQDTLYEAGYSDLFKFVGSRDIDPGLLKSHPNFVAAVRLGTATQTVFLINGKYLYEITMPIGDLTFDKIVSDIALEA